ncbi:MAG TPA: acetylxylan esterase [Candidatus Didemnitutus sp.]|jgi:cephalosporin-C deacetylase-like acetyl esterase
MKSSVSLIAAAALGLVLAARGHADTPITPVPVQANFRIATVQVRVAPDHRDWTYATGETAKFKVEIVADNEPIENVAITYTVGPEMMPAEAKTATVPADGLVIDGGTMKDPGFLRCIVNVEVAGHKYRGLATAGFSPEKILPTQVEPVDFQAFWDSGRKELAQIPIEDKLTLLPDACTDKVNVYHVSFRTVGHTWTGTGARIYGILCEPKTPGKYPAILHLPGAGVRAYSGDKNLAAHGAITLEIGVHGIPVNLPPEVYEQLAAGALNGYQYYNLDDRDSYYYHRIYLSCLRADDFLTQRPDWDGKNLIVMGGSQGGQLTLVTAGLDSRVTAIAVTYPAYCDVSGELHGRAGGWPHPFQPDPATGRISRQATPTKIATAEYYDAVNFARRITVPGYYTWGFNDETCPPTSTFAAFNIITAPKTLGLTLELGHSSGKEQGETTDAWVLKQAGLK